MKRISIIWICAVIVFVLQAQYGRADYRKLTAPESSDMILSGDGINSQETSAKDAFIIFEKDGTPFLSDDSARSLQRQETGGSDAGMKRVPLADPFILTYENKYYAYGTSSPDGIVVYTSDDLEYWTKNPVLALHKDNSYAERRFWAPEVYYVNGKFYMYYSADEHICVATGDSPLGPFKQDRHEPMMDEKAIDNSLFIDDDGKAYLFFVRFTDGNAVWVAELNDDLKTLKMETLHLCLHVSQDWENIMARVNEGPFVIKRNGIYYMTYSANHYQSHDYGIGVAMANQIMGNWEKYASNPLLRRPPGLFGAGHHCLFKDKNGRLCVAFHAHKSNNAVHPREMYITTAEFIQNQNTGEYMLSISPDYRIPYVK
ncbi:MAG: glycoside hydrolase family 43 protein [Tannerella sp.]|jgi:beta-xylosidase|nr:glycoside hydrolase family 43 protein [Tannerella sp.]